MSRKSLQAEVGMEGEDNALIAARAIRIGIATHPSLIVFDGMSQLYVPIK